MHLPALHLSAMRPHRYDRYGKSQRRLQFWAKEQTARCYWSSEEIDNVPPFMYDYSLFM